MRNILLPFEYIETIPHLVDCAVSLAKKYNSSVSGVAIHQRIDSFIAQEGSIVFDSLHHDENKEEAIKYKEKFMDHINTLKKSDSDLSDLKYKWLSEELENQKYLGDLSRVYNVVIISRPYQDLQSASLSSIQTILFDGGRPVMLIPMNKQIDIGKEVVISWNCTTESSRAVFASLPILKKANNVTILTVEKVITDGPSGEQVSELLASHGIDAKPVTIPTLLSASSSPNLYLATPKNSERFFLFISTSFSSPAITFFTTFRATFEISLSKFLTPDSFV